MDDHDHHDEDENNHDNHDYQDDDDDANEDTTHSPHHSGWWSWWGGWTGQAWCALRACGLAWFNEEDGGTMRMTSVVMVRMMIMLMSWSSWSWLVVEVQSWQWQCRCIIIDDNWSLLDRWVYIKQLTEFAYSVYCDQCASVYQCIIVFTDVPVRTRLYQCVPLCTSVYHCNWCPVRPLLAILTNVSVSPFNRTLPFQPAHQPFHE